MASRPLTRSQKGQLQDGDASPSSAPGIIGDKTPGDAGKAALEKTAAKSPAVKEGEILTPRGTPARGMEAPVLSPRAVALLNTIADRLPTPTQKSGKTPVDRAQQLTLPPGHTGLTPADSGKVGLSTYPTLGELTRNEEYLDAVAQRLGLSQNLPETAGKSDIPTLTRIRDRLLDDARVLEGPPEVQRLDTLDPAFITSRDKRAKPPLQDQTGNRSDLGQLRMAVPPTAQHADAPFYGARMPAAAMPPYTQPHGMQYDPCSQWQYGYPREPYAAWQGHMGNRGYAAQPSDLTYGPPVVRHPFSEAHHSTRMAPPQDSSTPAFHDHQTMVNIPDKGPAKAPQNPELNTSLQRMTRMIDQVAPGLRYKPPQGQHVPTGASAELPTADKEAQLAALLDRLTDRLQEKVTIMSPPRDAAATTAHLTGVTEKHYGAAGRREDDAASQQHEARETVNRSAVETRSPRFNPSAWRLRFNGTNVDLAHYLAQLECVALGHGWTDEQKGVVLLSSLEGPAVRVMNSIPSGCTSFGEISQRLREMFAPAANVVAYKAQFHGRVRRSNENSQEYSLALRELAYKAYPRMAASELDELMIDQFIKGQSQYVRIALASGTYPTLEAVVAAVIRLEAYSKGPSSGDAAPQQGARRGNGARKVQTKCGYYNAPLSPDAGDSFATSDDPSSEDAQLTGLEDCVEFDDEDPMAGILAAVDEYALSFAAEQPRSVPQRPCFYCKGTGHWFLACPQLLNRLRANGYRGPALGQRRGNPASRPLQRNVGNGKPVVPVPKSKGNDRGR